MQFPRKLVLAGVLLSLIPIGLGIAAIVTPQWMSTKNASNSSSFSLWICNNYVCLSNERFDAAKGLAIAGVVAIAVGAIVTLLFDIFIKNRWMQLIPLVVLFLGPVALIVGLILYIWAVVDYAGNNQQKLNKLGYSIFLMFASSLVGFLTAVYFAFATGFGILRRQQLIQPFIRSPIEIQQTSERF